MPLVPKAPSVQEIKDRAAQATAAVSSTASAVAGAGRRWRRSLRPLRLRRRLHASAVDVQPVWLVRRAAGVRVLRLRRAVLCHGRDQQASYRSTGNPEAKADACALMCNLAAWRPLAGSVTTG